MTESYFCLFTAAIVDIAVILLILICRCQRQSRNVYKGMITKVLTANRDTIQTGA